MFYKFPKNSILEINFTEISANLMDAKVMFKITISAMTPNVLGLDILAKNQEYIIILNGNSKHNSSVPINIWSSNLSVMDMIFKPLTKVEHTDITYVGLFNYRAAKQILEYLGLKMPSSISSLKAFKKYIEANRG